MTDNVRFERSGTLINRKFREYLIPTILVNMALSMEMVINSAVVGNLLGERPLSAIGLSAPIIYSLNALFLLFAIGGVTCAAISKGKRDSAQANRFFTLTFVAGMAVMLVLLLGLLVFMGPITYALSQGDAELAGLTRRYLTPMVFVGPVMMLIMGMAQFIRTDGWPRLSAYVALVANGVSLLTCYLLIRFFGMGIAGASISTLTGYTVGVFIMLPYLLSKRRSFRFVRLSGDNRARLLLITGIGASEALTQLLNFLRVLVLNVLIISVLGAPGMAAMTVCINALVLATIFVSGTTDTFLPIIGTLFGEKDNRGIRFTVRMGFQFMAIACVLLMAAFLILPEAVVRLFGIDSAEGIAVAVPALRMYALSMPFFGVNTLLQSFFQTTSRQKLASLIVILNGFAFVVVFAAAIARWNGNLIWLAFVLSELSTILVVMLVGMRIRKKENVNGILLLSKETKNERSLDLSIYATEKEATSLSEHVIQFCRENGESESTALRMGIAVEEMAVNTARYGHKNKKGVIDVLLRATDQELILRLRDDGVPFDPTEYHPEEGEEFAIGGIEVVRRLAKDVSYMRQLGFNVSIITILRTALEPV